MPYFKAQDGCRLYYETEGFESSKPVVAFLNGTMQSTLYWRPQATVFKGQYRVLMYDARGQGQSDLGNAKLSLEAHAGDFNQLLTHLDIDKADLVGLSHGAKIALAHAARSPARTGRLVLCSVSASLSFRSKLFVRSWLETLKTSGIEPMVWASLPVVFGEDFLKHKEKILKSIVEATVKRNRKEALIAHLEAMLHYSPLSGLASHIQNPCLVISGSDDPLVTEEEAQQVAALCSGELNRLLGIGHSVPVEAPALFEETVLEFLCRT